MTNEEAIIDIRENIQPIIGGKSLDIAISAIEKQIPNEEAQAEIESLEKENTVFGEIIKKQDDEINALRKDLLKRENLEESYSKSVKKFDKRLEKTVKLERAEAVKECLAKVKNYIKTHCNPYGKPDFDYDTSIKILNFIDNLAKEMVVDNSNDK